MPSTILITGGLGYIGSHTVCELVQALHDNTLEVPDKDLRILIIDNLSNSSTAVIPKMEQILDEYCGGKRQKPFFDYKECDMTNLESLREVFGSCVREEKPIKYIIHFAALKCVPESCEIPMQYFRNNFVGALNVVQCMEEFDCHYIVHSSSSRCYGNNLNSTENDAVEVYNPYAGAKLCVDYMLRSFCLAHKNWRAISVRYFNPCGAHPSGLIGEDPKYPHNLFPYIEEVAIGNREIVSVFGKDYNTKDGTGVRDYTHVCDIAKVHIGVMKKFWEIEGHEIYNIGTNNSYSVLEVIEAYSKAIGKEIPWKYAPRRAGDIDYTQSKADKAFKELKWKASKTLEECCKDSFKWKTLNRHGYENK